MSVTVEGIAPLHQDWARTVIAGLGRDAFTHVVGELLGQYYAPHFGPIPDLGPLPCFSRRLPRGGYPIGMGDTVGLYLIDHLPFHILTNPSREALHSPRFIETVQRVKQSHWNDSHVFVLNNSVFLTDGLLQDFVLPEYDAILSANNIELSMVGNADSIAANPTTDSFLANFLRNYGDGLSVALRKDGPRLYPFIAQSYLASGSMAQKSGPLEPMFVSSLRRQHLVIQEFQKLLVSMASERKIEEFLVAHYREVFGFRYDRITTQLWLRLPSADVSGKNRRIDLFLRNGVSGDWELFELKRSTVHLTGTYRDIPTLAKTVHDSVLQIENYLRLLAQDQVRQRFQLEGIEYFEPIPHLVIGRRPSIDLKEWRWLMSKNRSGINIVTYDDLLNEMKARLLPFMESRQ